MLALVPSLLTPGVLEVTDDLEIAELTFDKNADALEATEVFDFAELDLDGASE